MKLKPEYRRLYAAIDAILWEEWDPIGAVPRCEYTGYTPQIFQLKIRKASVEDIARELLKYETEFMGLPGKTENCMRVAGIIAGL